LAKGRREQAAGAFHSRRKEKSIAAAKNTSASSRVRDSDMRSAALTEGILDPWADEILIASHAGIRPGVLFYRETHCGPLNGINPSLCPSFRAYPACALETNAARADENGNSATFNRNHALCSGAVEFVSPFGTIIAIR
jgi:hypothetical protein